MLSSGSWVGAITLTHELTKLDVDEKHSETKTFPGTWPQTSSSHVVPKCNQDFILLQTCAIIVINEIRCNPCLIRFSARLSAT